MTVVHWQWSAQDGKARSGVLHTPHGEVVTPAFMAVGTQGALKGVTVQQAEALGQGIILGNTYHLALRPGAERVQALGGLHGLSGWRGPMLTDSGGYQVFSLAANRQLDEQGVTFRSHIDGSRFHLSPESSIHIQRRLQADIIMAFDECPSLDADHPTLRASIDRTLRWLERSHAAWQDSAIDLPGGPQQQAMFGIVQGGLDLDLRAHSLAGTVAIDCPGYAIGGLSVGESAVDRNRILDAVAHQLPANKPRYLMGVGTPLDIVEAVARGVDLFDCVLPTRMGRHGIAYTDHGPLHCTNACHASDPAPLDPDTPSEASRISRGAIRHLLKAKESLGGQLVSLHNLAYYQRLMARLRQAIADQRLSAFAEDFRAKYHDRAKTEGP